MVAGKDGVMRVLELQRLDGHPPRARVRIRRRRSAAPVAPGGGELFTRTCGVAATVVTPTMFLADEHAAPQRIVLAGGRLHLAGRTRSPAPAR